MLLADYAFCLAIAFMVGCNLYYGPRIRSPRIAMQWGFDGLPTWYAPKAIGLWGIVALALAVRLLIWILSNHAPETMHGSTEVGVLLLSIIFAAAHFLTLRAAAETN